MPAKLPCRLVEKPWGRDSLPGEFGGDHGRRIGEAWFEGPGELPLLVKYLFTNERLSVQVHPDDGQARALGYRRGKSECWYVVDAEEGATIGLGFLDDLGPEELRRAALDGSIERLLEWQPVAAGDFIYVPAGTVHAIGTGLTLLEIQQNSDVTYRLYDYGRPRELHLDEAVAVAHRGGYPRCCRREVNPDVAGPLLDGPIFSVVHAAGETGSLPSNRRRWVVPIAGAVRSGGLTATVGECLLAESGEGLDLDGARALVALEGTL